MLKTTIFRLRYFRSILLFLSIFSAFLFMGPGYSRAADVTLAWDANQESTVAGYKVFNGLASRTYNGTVDVGNWTSCTISGLAPGTTYYLAAKAYDAAGHESDFSTEIAYTVPAACSFSLSPTSQSFASSAGSGSIAVTAPSGCSWSASSSASWITITAGSGSGNGAVTFSVASNSTSSTRAANINIGSQTFSVSQAAATTPTCSFSLSPTSQSFTSSAGSGSIAVTAPSGCSWSASSSASWITITAGSGSGNGAVTYSVASNSASSTRTASISIGGQAFSVSQAAAAATSSYTITVSAGPHGSISPSGAVAVNKGASKTFTITPGWGYKVYRVLVNGASIGAVNTYTFSNIIANQTIRAEFKSKWSW